MSTTYTEVEDAEVEDDEVHANDVGGDCGAGRIPGVCGIGVIAAGVKGDGIGRQAA